MALTIKQEKFCQAYFNEGNATQAYREVYTDAMTDGAAKQAAYELLQKAHIRARVEELQAQALEATMITAEQRLLWLKEAILLAQHKGHSAGIIGAVNEMNKMLGGHASSPIDYSGKLEIVTLQTCDNQRGVSNIAAHTASVISINASSDEPNHDDAA